MGAGVSLSLSRDGVHGESISCVAFVPSSKEYGYLDGCILLVFRSANGAVFLVPDTREHGSDSSARDHDLFGEINLLGLKGAAGVDLGDGQDSGRRDLAFPAQVSRIGYVKLTILDLDLMGLVALTPDPSSSLSLDHHKGVKALPTAEQFDITKPMPSSVFLVKGSEASVIPSSASVRSDEGSDDADVDLPSHKGVSFSLTPIRVADAGYLFPAGPQGAATYMSRETNTADDTFDPVVDDSGVSVIAFNADTMTAAAGAVYDGTVKAINADGISDLQCIGSLSSVHVRCRQMPTPTICGVSGYPCCV